MPPPCEVKTVVTPSQSGVMAVEESTKRNLTRIRGFGHASLPPQHGSNDAITAVAGSSHAPTCASPAGRKKTMEHLWACAEEGFRCSATTRGSSTETLPRLNRLWLKEDRLNSEEDGRCGRLMAVTSSEETGCILGDGSGHASEKCSRVIHGWCSLAEQCESSDHRELDSSEQLETLAPACAVHYLFAEMKINITDMFNRAQNMNLDLSCFLETEASSSLVVPVPRAHVVGVELRSGCTRLRHFLTEDGEGRRSCHSPLSRCSNV
ncbi:hypothetical protein INR49_023394 [Caranx melampygus]|nr:hypothetical protein INR49_023394 [Caranx melampygus]